MKFTLDWNEYKAKARRIAAEGCVLLRNEEDVLPLDEDSEVAVFGRIQLDYAQYKSGTGSGGLVNAPYAVSVNEGLQAAGISINETLLKAYQAFEEAHPFDNGPGWAQEPTCQVEMPLGDALVEQAASETDTAIVIIGRSAGEDKDALAEPGSYYLNETEAQMMEKVTRAFPKTIVLLNVGAIMDMSWIDTYHPQAVMYIWQGGSEGGNGVADVLTGKVSPCGKLADTIAYELDDYPSMANFGDPKENFYVEDIYVGYRYFETFAREAVRFPFGFGLSYTTFRQHVTGFSSDEDSISVTVQVSNTGTRAGKEVVQVYCEAPQGALDKPARVLVGFEKTSELPPGDSETMIVRVPLARFASYDDSGRTRFESAWVLEQGTYIFYAGEDVRSAEEAGHYVQKKTIYLKQLEEALRPVDAFRRVCVKDGQLDFEDVPLRTISPAEKISRDRKPALPYTGDQGIRLKDVKDGTASMDDFLAQLSDEDLIAMARGEGMCSPKVTPGIAGAWGGVTERLKAFGIPVAGCSDGPSGIRMDCGAMAMSNPSGTLIACSWNKQLAYELFICQGKELRLNKIDALLGPGMNIHRNPLNGRNFEYFSEDPLLTGLMAASELQGLHVSGVDGTIKHFACNNQEKARNFSNMIVSERALREIYLKGFEIAVTEGEGRSIMTMYGGINGVWAAGNYDLLTSIVRQDWGYDGFVMTDWWALINDEGKQPVKENITAMIRAQNDVYMVTGNAAANTNHDNAEEGLKNGDMTRSDLVRNAANICRFVMHRPVMDRFLGITDEITEIDRPRLDMGDLYTQPDVMVDPSGSDMNVSGMHTEVGTGNVFPMHFTKTGYYGIELKASTKLGDLAQINMTVYDGKIVVGAWSMQGGSDEVQTHQIQFFVSAPNMFLNFFFAQSGMDMVSMKVRLLEETDYQKKHDEELLNS